MASPNLQTIIVYKEYVPDKGARKGKCVKRTRAQAKKIAEQFKFRNIYTSRETQTSYRFRQRPPEDFVASSFRTKRLPEFGVSLVYGRLKKGKSKKKKNPGEPDVLDQDIKVYKQYHKKLDRLRNDRSKKRQEKQYELARLCRAFRQAPIDTPFLQDFMRKELVDYAVALEMPQVYNARTRKRKTGDLFSRVCQAPTKAQRDLFENPSKAPKHVRLKNPTQMPDPGPLALLGETLEFAWSPDTVKQAKKTSKKWRPGDPGKEVWAPKGKWLFLWSPKYKAVIAIKKPRSAPKKSQVSREGGAAKVSERFHARPAEKTWEMEVPQVPLAFLGRAVHIVYRSDKWSPTRETTDYIHDFKQGVKLYCGPSLKRPEVFLCFGGKLTVTERGLVF